MKKKGISFGRKLMFSYLLLLVIVGVGFVIQFFQTISYIFDNNAGYLMQYNAQVSLSLDALISDDEEFEYIYLIDSRVERIFQEKPSNSLEEKEEDRQYIRDMLLLWANVNPYAIRSTIKLEDGRIYSSINDDVTDYIASCEEKFANVDWSDRTRKNYSDIYCCEIYQVDYEVVTCASKIYDVDGETCIGTVYLDLDWEDIQNVFAKNVIKDVDNGFVILSNNMIMLSAKENQIDANGGAADLIQRSSGIWVDGNESIVIPYNNKKYLMVGVRNQSTGWYVLGYIPTDTIWKNALYAASSILIWMFIFLGIAVFVAKLFANQMSRPIAMLSGVMSSSVEGKVELFTEENHWNDEVGELIDNYNRMGRRLNEMIQRVYIYQLNQKQTQLRMLQYQINPHFLYNALNTVSSIARLADVEYIPEIAEGLSNMFRYSIKGDDFVSIDDELKQVENYLSIMKVRFPEKYEVEMNVQEDLRSYGMLKLVIQPLVENSMHHAFGTMNRKKNVLKISVYESGLDRITISVYDDGVGMSEEQVSELNQFLLDVKGEQAIVNPNGGIGLRNVNARLKNYYGDDYHLYVESKKGEYTCIYFSIKKVEIKKNEK